MTLIVLGALMACSPVRGLPFSVFNKSGIEEVSRHVFYTAMVQKEGMNIRKICLGAQIKVVFVTQSVDVV